MASRERSFTVSNGKVTYGADRSSYQYQYDACNNLTRLVTSVGTNKWNTTYTYDADNRPKTTTLSTGKVITNTYDTVNRLTKRTIGLSSTYTTTLEYYANTATLSKYKNGTDLAYVYLYDDNGNITQIKQNGVEVIGYTYDSADRLTRENNTFSNETVTYTYDTWGNLTSKKTYAYTTGTLGTAMSTLTYTYGNSAWCDQLTKLNGVTIPYDGNGNPLTYREWTFNWRGKQLINGTKDSNTISFAYDENGLRHKKVYNGVTTNYYYNGSVLIGMERSGTNYLFSYDASGNVVSVKYNGAEYYYLRNGQGDIVKLIDGSGATVVEYKYDTWGSKISTTGSMAGTLGLIQPFRYRGYVYDFEWGMYYLQSRYYDPVTCRFISSDVMLSTGQGVLGHNSYAYCLDNPVRYKDSQGMEAEDGSNDSDPVRRFLAKLLLGENSSPSMDKTVESWCAINIPLTKQDHLERGGIIISRQFLGKKYYSVGFCGSQSNKTCWKVFGLGYFVESFKPFSKIEGFVHIHTAYPQPDGTWKNVDYGPSPTDRYLFLLPGIRKQYLANEFGDIYEFPIIGPRRYIIDRRQYYDSFAQFA